MKSTPKLSELKGVTPLENPENVKGGFFFFLSYLFGGYNKQPQYQAPQNNYYGGGKEGKKDH
jgi:hypothetical protein